MELSMTDLKELISGRQEQSFPFTGKVFIRTVTFHYTGEVTVVSDGWVFLRKAAWVADSGRWATALKTGELSEIEPYPDEVAVSLASIVDVSPWLHDLPRDQK